MLTAYVAVGGLAAAATGTIATLSLARSQYVVQNMARVGLQPWTLYPLGGLKLAGALGLLIGIGVPALGVAAAIGLVVFFVGAILTHVRAREYSTIPFPAMFLVLAAAALALRVAAS